MSRLQAPARVHGLRSAAVVAKGWRMVMRCHGYDHGARVVASDVMTVGAGDDRGLTTSSAELGVLLGNELAFLKQ